MQTKTCTQCKEEKPATLEFFHAYKRSKVGVRSDCRVCRAKDHADNREERAARKKIFWEKNKERLNAITRANYVKNSEDRKEKARARYHNKRDENIKRMAEYRSANLDSLNERRRPKARQRNKERYGTDLVYTLKNRVKSLIRRSIRKGIKSETMEKCLGYGIEEIKNHLESKFVDGMNWDSFLAGEIHIDHKIPICFYKPTSTNSEEFRECWKLDNLQPLWAKDNLSKAGRLVA